MEKVVAALWAPPAERTALAAALRAAGATRIRLNLRDAAVASGAGHVQRWQEPDAVAQFWLPSANPRFFAAAADALAAASERFAAWLVTESTVIANIAHPSVEGERTWGWSQATFLAFRPDLDPPAAEAHWRTRHTEVAIETQANFEYVQNRVVRALTPDAPAYDAFIEECFPIEALTDPHAFFDAVGDEPKYHANLATMMESCGAFIDFTRIDVIPTSQYDFA
ncbi:EthD domain-containing protein [Leptolyngbya sp. 15MV]|nr:EthD domain-containing protein [Leptolyngbya sp. 15MV]